jgi:chromosome segregation ATPase
MLKFLTDVAEGNEMLVAVAPHCLRSTREERHRYQTDMIDALEKVLLGVEAERKDVLAASQEDLVKAEADRESAVTALAAADNKVSECQAEKDAKDSMQLELDAVVSQRSKELVDAQAHEKSLEQEQSQNLQEREDCQKFMSEKWEPLKAGSFPGKEWRERNRQIDAAVQALDKMGLDASLKSCLPTALKTKPLERGRFATKAVEFSESVMGCFLESTAEKTSKFDQEAATRARASAASKENLDAAEAKLGEGKAATKDAQGALLNAEKARSDAKVAHDSAPQRVEECKAGVEQEKASLSHAQDILSLFMALKDKTGTAPTSDEAPKIQQEATTVPAQ